MKTIKGYSLSLLALISTAPLGAMQEVKKQTRSVACTADTVKQIKFEVDTLAGQIASDLKAMHEGEPKKRNTVSHWNRLRLTRYALALPARLHDLQVNVTQFLEFIKKFDATMNYDEALECARQIRKIGKEMKPHFQRASAINEISVKLGTNNIQELSNKELLKQLAETLQADVQKIVNFDVHEQKVSGALKLGQTLKPFVAQMTGNLAELEMPLRTYIRAAEAFDNDTDTALMEVLYQAIEILSEHIGALRSKENTKSATVKVTDKMGVKLFDGNGAPSEIAKVAAVKPQEANRDAKTLVTQNNSQKPKSYDQLLADLSQVQDQAQKAIAQESNHGAISQKTEQVKPEIASARIEIEGQPKDNTIKGKQQLMVGAGVMAVPAIIAAAQVASQAGYLDPVMNYVSSIELPRFNSESLKPFIDAVNPYKAAAALAGLGSAGVGAYTLNQWFKKPVQGAQIQSASHSAQIKEEPAIQETAVQEIDEADLKPLPKHKARLTSKKAAVAGAAGLGLAGLGYAAYTYLAQQPDFWSGMNGQAAATVAPTITQAAVNATQAVSPAVNTLSMPAINVATSDAGQQIYHWLTRTALDPFI